MTHTCLPPIWYHFPPFLVGIAKDTFDEKLCRDSHRSKPKSTVAICPMEADEETSVICRHVIVVARSILRSYLPTTCRFSLSSIF
ncbi:hypothetical protein ACE6H2_001044 [Prunus campanulata]